MDCVGQILSRQDKDGCYTKEKNKAYETMKPKRISKEEILRLMEEKKQLKEVSHYSKTAYEYVYMWMCLHVFHLSNTLFNLLDSSKIAREAAYSCFKS